MRPGAATPAGCSGTNARAASRAHASTTNRDTARGLLRLVADVRAHPNRRAVCRADDSSSAVVSPEGRDYQVRESRWRERGCYDHAIREAARDGMDVVRYRDRPMRDRMG